MKKRTDITTLLFAWVRFSSPAIAVALAVLMKLAGGAYAQSDVLVTKAGSPDPDGTAPRPYHTIKSGILGTSQPDRSNTLVIDSGNYHETFTKELIDKPGLFLTAKGGRVNIGDMSGVTSSTTLRIVSLNTHMFGQDWYDFGPAWEDNRRAEDIGDQLAGLRSDGVDVVAMQENWDTDDVFFSRIYPRSGYASARHGGMIFPPSNVLNSGLSFLFDYLYDDAFYQDIYESCSGFAECRATKGYIVSTIQKNGFTISIFNTHLQSGGSDGEKAARRDQVRQLRDAIVSFRSYYPDRAIFLAGDFNISGDGEVSASSEYYATLIAEIGEFAGGMDGDRNAPGFALDGSTSFTQDGNNWVYKYIFRDPRWELLDTCVYDAIWPEPSARRLDYIFYFPSLDGSVEIIPSRFDVVAFEGRNGCKEICIQKLDCPPDILFTCIDTAFYCTDDSTDHYGIDGTFVLNRLN